MKRIQWAFAGLLILLSALWWAANPTMLATQGFLPWRSLFIDWTGVMAIGVMSVALMLAVRPVLFEPWLGGLDKMYRLHKWLGVAALVVSILHWVGSQSPKWLVGLGWMERPVRVRSTDTVSAVQQLLGSQRGLAESVGELAFYALVLLIVLALVKRFPYRHFFKTHRLLAVAYLVLVFHAVVLMRWGEWPTPLGVLVALLMVGGSAAAVRILLRRIGHSRKAVGEVSRVELLPGVGVLNVHIQLKDRWAGHEAGQFAFVSFDKKEGAHPFTLTSAWNGDGHLGLLIKGLGDHTRALITTLKAGQLVTVEGPYGQFNFRGEQPRQIWVGGGIGITPFVARMKALALQPDGKSIDFFHTTAERDEQALALLRRDAAAAKVHLHLLVDAEDGRLDVQRICAAVPDWKHSGVWFCGPAAFGQALRREFLAQGLPAAAFHQELFDMR
jgi:predicted ferric reductase